MKLVLKNNKYRNENYSCNIWIDDRRVESYDLNGKDELIIDIQQGSNVKIEIQNMFLKSDKKVFLMFFYWILSFFSGSGEYMPFGKSFDAVVRIEKADKENIYIQTNDIKSKEAFSVKTDGNVVENKFVSPKGYKIVWLFGYALPIFLLILAITLIILLVEFQERFCVIKRIFLMMSAICGVGWMIYILNILKK